MIKKHNNFFWSFIIVLLVSLYPSTLLHAKKEVLKILMVVPCFPKIHDICMLNQMIGLIERGHEVYISTPHLGDTVNVQEDVVKYNLLAKTIVGDLPANLDKYDIVVFQLGH